MITLWGPALSVFSAVACSAFPFTAYIPRTNNELKTCSKVQIERIIFFISPAGKNSSHVKNDSHRMRSEIAVCKQGAIYDDFFDGGRSFCRHGIFLLVGIRCQIRRDPSIPERLERFDFRKG
jgi:hypothetical protein